MSPSYSKNRKKTPFTIQKSEKRKGSELIDHQSPLSGYKKSLILPTYLGGDLQIVQAIGLILYRKSQKLPKFMVTALLYLKYVTAIYDVIFCFSSEEDESFAEITITSNST
jgi:hypothetical protein